MKGGGMSFVGMPWFFPLPIVVLCICIGILLSGFLILAYVFAIDRKGLYGAIAMLSLLGLCFVGSELAVVLCGFAGRIPLGRQFHRIQALSASVFIFAVPLYLSYLLESKPVLRNLNRWVTRMAFLFAASLVAIAFIKPDLFLGMGPKVGVIKPWSGGRATPGPAYFFRDCLITLIGLYTIFMLHVEFKLYRHKRHIIITLIGTAIAVVSGFIDVAIAQVERPTGLFCIRFFSAFSVGMTVFDVSCMIGVLNWYIEQTKTISRAQKLEALSLLAGGIAHDFNNILCGILGNTALLREIAAEEGRGALDDIEKAVLRARALSGQMITYARGGVQRRGNLDLVALVRELADSSLANSGVSYSLYAEKGLWQAWADPIQIGQVVQNLLLNAKEAMQGQGRITIKIGNYLHKAILSTKKAGRYVSVSIKDTGPGVMKEHEKRIFDPYFSTKDNGSGLGLSVCWAILENHGGSIELVPVVDGGAEFLVHIPAAQAHTENAISKLLMN